MASPHEYYRGKSTSLEGGIRILIDYLRETENDIAVTIDHQIAESTPELSRRLDIDHIIEEDPTADNESFKSGFDDGKQLLLNIVPISRTRSLWVDIAEIDL